MKSGAFAFAAFLVPVVVFAACSSDHTQPPIESGGSLSNGEPGGSISGAAADASVRLDAAEDDGAVVDGGDAGTCSSATCPAGCCATTGVCVLLFTNAQCGNTATPGGACQFCAAGQSCQVNGCQ